MSGFLTSRALVTSAVSTVNSTTDPLNAGETFTGEAVRTSGYTTVLVTAKTDKATTVYVDWSSDAENWDLIQSYSVAAETFFSQRLPVSGVFVRVRATNTALSAQTYLRLTTIQTTAQDGAEVSVALTNADNVSISASNQGSSTAVACDASGRLVTSLTALNVNDNTPTGLKATAMGELLVSGGNHAAYSTDSVTVYGQNLAGTPTAILTDVAGAVHVTNITSANSSILTYAANATGGGNGPLTVNGQNLLVSDSTVNTTISQLKTSVDTLSAKFNTVNDDSSQPVLRVSLPVFGGQYPRVQCVASSNSGDILLNGDASSGALFTASKTGAELALDSSIASLRAAVARQGAYAADLDRRTVRLQWTANSSPLVVGMAYPPGDLFTLFGFPITWTLASSGLIERQRPVNIRCIVANGTEEIVTMAANQDGGTAANITATGGAISWINSISAAGEPTVASAITLEADGGANGEFSGQVASLSPNDHNGSSSFFVVPAGKVCFVESAQFVCVGDEKQAKYSLCTIPNVTSGRVSGNQKVITSWTLSNVDMTSTTVKYEGPFGPFAAGTGIYLLFESASSGVQIDATLVYRLYSS